MKATDFQSLYTIWMQDIWSLEEQMVEALPKMEEKASSPRLKQAFADHLWETKGHLDRANQILENLRVKPSGHRCQAMIGLIREVKDVMGEVESGPLLDAALIGAAQKVEHYEVACYGTAVTFAHLLGRDWDASTLQTSLREEYRTDDLLTEIARQQINTEALQTVQA